MKAIETFVYLAVATFVLFTGSSFFAVGFAFQGTLIEAILWSLFTGLALLCGYGLAGGIFYGLFRLESLGRIGEFIIGALAGAGVLFLFGWLFPTTMVFPDVLAAMVAGSIGSALVVCLGAVTGRVTFAGNLLPRRKPK